MSSPADLASIPGRIQSKVQRAILMDRMVRHQNIGN
jgi:hypothetical protein